MKCLIVTKSAEPNGIEPEELLHHIACLESFGIKYKRAFVETMPSDKVVNGFDFILYPTLNSGFLAPIDSASITIPQIGMHGSAGAAGYGTLSGVTGSRTSLQNIYFNAAWTNEPWLCAYGGSYELSNNGTSIMSVSANSPLTGAPQTNANNTIAWKQPCGGSTLYASSIYGRVTQILPFLIQEAINDGLLSAPPRKAPIVVDIDHINGFYTNTYGDGEVLDNISSFVPDGGVIWAGIYNANVAYFDNMAQPIIDKLKKYSGKPFLYCWHDHTFSPLIQDNVNATGHSTPPSPTKTEIYNKYLADKATWESLGLNWHFPAYYNCGSNSWEENSLELFSGDLSLVSSGDNLTEQVGFGFTVFRTGGTNSERNYGGSSVITGHNQYHNKRKFRGIQIIQTRDMAWGNAIPATPSNDMPYDTDIKWRNNFKYLMQSVYQGCSVYLHDEDFLTDYQEPGVSQQGFTVMQQIVDMCEQLKDLTIPFANPVDHVTNRRFI